MGSRFLSHRVNKYLFDSINSDKATSDFFADMSISRRRFLQAMAVLCAVPIVSGCSDEDDVNNPSNLWEVDDGNTAIPGAATGEPTRIIVVGAGFAGLACANALATAGVDVVVLEALERLGGRVHTVELGGVPVDLGAAWIHSPIGNPLTELARRAKVQRVAFPLDLLIADATMFDMATGRLSREETVILVNALTQFALAIPQLITQLGSQASLAMAMDSFFTQSPVEAVLLPKLEALIRMVFETSTSGLLEQVSLANFEVPQLYQGGDDLPKSGFAPMIDALAAPVSVQLESPVNSVHVLEDGIEVMLANGSIERGSHVVITTPLGVLQAGAIDFQPGLPAAKQEAISALGFGTFEKLALRYPEKFWDTSGNALMAYSSDNQWPLPLWVDISDEAGVPLLVAASAGTAGERFVELEETQLNALARETLQKITGEIPPIESATLATNWKNNPWTRGAYTFLSVGSGIEDIVTLGKPMHGRVLFAGEHTSPQRFGYADGAFTSGVREAKRLLRQSRVSLRIARSS